MTLTQTVVTQSRFILSGRWIIPAAIGTVAIVALLAGSYFVVPQTDVAFVKRFGKVLNPQEGPLQPGLHLKLPFIEDGRRLSPAL
jgi:regulator of protease activity HflC (stomatin/prohibitin superfamily)